MKFSTTEQSAVEFSTPCLIIGVTTGSRLRGAAAAVNKASNGALLRLIKRGDIATGTSKFFLWPDLPGVEAERVLIVGCGKPEKLSASVLQTVTAGAMRFLTGRGFKAAACALPEVTLPGRDLKWKTRHCALACAHGVYRYSTTKRSEKNRSRLNRMVFFGDRSLRAGLNQASAISRGVERARELGNLPPNICNPSYLAQECRTMADNLPNCKARVLGRKQMEEMGMGALLGVAQGSHFPPKLIVLNYTGAAAKEKPHVLVGKGITFDTGGISLKPGKGMDEMKYDMGGAAAVIGAFEACALLKLKVNLITLVPAVENMPDGKSYRPGDVLTSLSGQTIEVLNTDAEGRLILCDALTYAERFKPKSVIDVATLTGACVVALGKHASGLMSQDDKLADALLKAGEATHDRAWRLPIWDDYQPQLDSPYADMANIGGPSAGAITAGCFLSRFAGKFSWAHLDIAGTAWEGGSRNGASGRPVGLLTQYIIDQTEN
ncbi:MAG: leucyl aminopeptidase [Pseudomonadota bacterium]